MEKKYELKDLKFSQCEQLDNVMDILDFDSEKLEIIEIVEKFLILYDNKSSLLGIQAFCKIMNQLASVKIWEVFATIHSKICSKILSLKTFSNLWDNPYKLCLLLIMALRFTCGESEIW